MAGVFKVSCFRFLFHIFNPNVMKQAWKIILAVVLTAAIVGGGVYAFMSSVEIEFSDEVEDLADAELQDEACYLTYDEVDYTGLRLSFDYPCDWETRDPGVGVVASSSDGEIEISYPAGEFGLHGTELIDEENLTINGYSYLIKTYNIAESDNMMILVDMEDDFSEHLYEFVVRCQHDSDLSDWEAILRSVEFDMLEEGRDYDLEEASKEIEEIIKNANENS
jgi:hypothetical protein